jgi:hypothetical protein
VLYGKFQPYLQFSVSRIIGRDPSKKERAHAQTDQLISPMSELLQVFVTKRAMMSTFQQNATIWGEEEVQYTRSRMIKKYTGEVLLRNCGCALTL